MNSPLVRRIILMAVAALAPLILKLFHVNISPQIVVSWAAVVMAVGLVMYRQAAGDKDWWTSKTNWTAIVGAAVLALQQNLNINIDPADITVVIAAIVGVVGLLAKILHKPLDSTKG